MIAELKERWKGEMPEFWKKVEQIWNKVILLSGFITGGEVFADISQIQILIPEDPTLVLITTWLTRVCHYALIVGLIAKYQARLTKVDPPKDVQ